MNPDRMLVDLLGSSTDLQTHQGAATVRAIDRLNLFSPFWKLAVKHLASHFVKPENPRPFERCHFVYNGHATFTMTSLIPTMRAAGFKQVTLMSSARTGSTEARAIMMLQKPTDSFFAGHSHPTSLVLGKRPKLEHKSPINHDWDVETLMNQIVDRPPPSSRLEADALAMQPWKSLTNDVVIVDKLGPWLKGLEDPLPKDVLEGRVRCIVHNRDDVEALGDRADKVWGVNLANSLIKKLEARFIGEQYALLGAREAREAWGERIGDVPVYVLGFGLLGEQVARGLSRLGMPRHLIKVIDSDPIVRARAERLGFSTAIEPTRPRPDKSVVFVATPGPGVSRANIHDFAERTIVLSLTSGGKGIDQKSLEDQRRSSTEVRKHRTGTRAAAVVDHEMVVQRMDGTTTELRLLNNPNLGSDNMWNDRYQVTSIGVSAATMQAGLELKGPGIVAFDHDLDLKLVRANCRSGLWERRPLWARPGDDPALLLADLDAFKPKG